MPHPGFAQPDLYSIPTAGEQEEPAQAARGDFSAHGYPLGDDDPPSPPTSGIDRAIRRSTAAAVLAVAGIAAYVSYWHAYAVVHAHGETGITARLEPATIDGLVYASSMVVLYAARHRVPVPSLARWLLGLGIAATLTANMAQGWSHGPVGAVVAAWPAVSLVGSYELSPGALRLSHDVALDAPTEGFCNTSPWAWCSLSSLIRSPAVADPPHVQHLTWWRRVVDHGSTRMIREDVRFVPQGMSSWSGSSARPEQQNTSRGSGTSATPRHVLLGPQLTAPSSAAGASGARQIRNGSLRLRPPGRRPSTPAGGVTRRYLRPAPSMTLRWPRTAAAPKPVIRCPNASWPRCSDAPPAAGRAPESPTPGEYRRRGSPGIRYSPSAPNPCSSATGPSGMLYRAGAPRGAGRVRSAGR